MTRRAWLDGFVLSVFLVFSGGALSAVDEPAGSEKEKAAGTFSMPGRNISIGLRWQK